MRRSLQTSPTDSGGGASIAAGTAAPLVSVVMPCLNEADTLEACIRKAREGIARSGVAGEVVVADNGSTDASVRIAEEAGARVVRVTERGYGSALLGGIAAARGRFVIMGDADDSYDFREVVRFVEKLREGFELVQGCRLPSGGGRILPGAMPFLHRWIGNPLLSKLVRLMFRAPIHDVYCGMRGFTKDLFERLDLRCTGMEFATEMIVKASLDGVLTAEVPITLHPDGRKAHAPHLKTFHDGWRTVRFFMISSPRWLFLGPGIALVALGLVGYMLALPGARILGFALDAHTLMVASLALLLGEQAILFAVFVKTFAISDGILPPDPRMDRFFQIFTLEKGLVLSAVAIVAGIGLLVVATNEWRLTGFGPLDYSRVMRFVIPGVTLVAMGFQAALGSFVVSILGMRRR